MQELLKVTVRKKDKLLFSDWAESVSSTNEAGPFDVLPRHKNFVCIIKEKLEIRSPQKKPLSIPVERGIFQARDNQVEIYLFQKNQEETKYGPTHLTDGPEH
jgi:F0F1-type ATP synthase epsilon subunit